MSSQMALDSSYIIFCHLCTLLCRPLQGRKTRRREIAENVNYEGKKIFTLIQLAMNAVFCMFNTRKWE